MLALRLPLVHSARTQPFLVTQRRIARAAAVLTALGAACGQRSPRIEPSALPAPTATASASVAPPRRANSNELEPGTERMFNLTLPVGSILRGAHDNTASYFIAQPMPLVMRYLQRRLEIIDGDIHPLGAMIRRARVITAPESTTPQYVDVAIRDENGEGTQVTLWRRATNERRFDSLGDALRAAGFDPRTGRPLEGNND